MRGVVLTAFPDFVKEERTGLIGATVQIVLQAAFFLARWRDKCAELGFKEQLLAFLGTKQNDEGEGALGEFGGLGAARFAAGAPLGGTPLSRFRHIGGDCTPTGRGSNRDLWGWMSMMG